MNRIFAIFSRCLQPALPVSLPQCTAQGRRGGGWSAVVAALLTLAAGAVGPGAHAQVLLNGSFENPAMSNGSFVQSGGTDWTATSAVFVITDGFGNGTTPYGNQFLQVYAGNSVSQTVNSGFSLGTPYTFSLAASEIVGNSGAQFTVTITGGGMAVPVSQTFVLPPRVGAIASAIPFDTYEMAFTPTANLPVTFQIQNTSFSSQVTLFDQVGVAVPEPGSALLLAVAGAGLLARRRRG